jgi:hypothetical protein
MRRNIYFRTKPDICETAVYKVQTKVMVIRLAYSHAVVYCNSQTHQRSVILCDVRECVHLFIIQVSRSVQCGGGRKILWRSL